MQRFLSSRGLWAVLLVVLVTAVFWFPVSSNTAQFRVLQWQELVPTGWNPAKQFADLNLSQLSDQDPRAEEFLKRMREAWDNAPTNPALEGAAVKLAGYLVPLEQSKGGIKEFLLVPYFGACIHSPPPPANQIVHVVMQEPITGFKTMDTLWVSGVLKAARRNTDMGVSGYTLQGVEVTAYKSPPR